jgi:hypothetical protein
MKSRSLWLAENKRGLCACTNGNDPNGSDAYLSVFFLKNELCADSRLCPNPLGLREHEIPQGIKNQFPFSFFDTLRHVRMVA